MSDLMLIMLRWLVTLGQIVITIFLPDPPPALSQESISAIRLSHYQSEIADRLITDPDDIERFVDFLNGLKTRWCPASAPMGGEWGVVMRIGDEDVTSFSISRGSVYSRSKSGVIYRGLSEDEWAEFEAILATAEIVPTLRSEPSFSDDLPIIQVPQRLTKPAVHVPFPWMKALGLVAAGYLGSFVPSILVVGAVERSERLIRLIRLLYAPVFLVVQIVGARAFK